MPHKKQSFHGSSAHHYHEHKGGKHHGRHSSEHHGRHGHHHRGGHHHHSEGHHSPKPEKGKPNKIHKVMHEFKRHELHSGSKHGPKVKSRKQAIAIGLSEQREANRGGYTDSTERGG